MTMVIISKWRNEEFVYIDGYGFVKHIQLKI